MRRHSAGSIWNAPPSSIRSTRGVREALAIERQRTSPDELLTLIYRAHEGYMLAEYQQDHSKKPEKAPERWERSKKAAEDALTLAAKSPDHPNAGAAIYGANIALATHALRAGNRQEAVRLMGEAAKAPASEGFATPIFHLELRLVNYLLKAGERESVAAFLERSAELRPLERDRLLKDAGDIRAGVMTSSYNATIARDR